MNNPLLDFSGLPRFSAVRPEHVAPAVDQLIAEGRATIERLAAARRARPPGRTSSSRSTTPTSASRAPGRRSSHLNAVVNTPELRDAYNAALPKVTQYFTEQGQDQRLHAGFKALARRRRLRARSPRARRRHRRQRAARLPPRRRGAAAAEKARFLADPGGAREARLALPGQRARRDQRLRPLRDRRARALRHSRGRARHRAPRPRRRTARDGWKLTLHMPCYMPVMQYADHHGAARAHVPRLRRRAPPSSASPSGTTTPTSARILELRARGGAAAGLRQLRRGLARHQDGGDARARRSPSSRTSRARAQALRRARHGGAARLRARRARHGRACAPGTSPT